MSETKHAPFLRWTFVSEDHGYWYLEWVLGPKETVTLLTHSEEYGVLVEATRDKILTSVNARPKVEELVQAVLTGDFCNLSDCDCGNSLDDKAHEVEAALTP